MIEIPAPRTRETPLRHSVEDCRGCSFVAMDSALFRFLADRGVEMTHLSVSKGTLLEFHPFDHVSRSLTCLH